MKNMKTSRGIEIDLDECSRCELLRREEEVERKKPRAPTIELIEASKGSVIEQIIALLIIMTIALPLR
jgi:hypothetical protein